MKKGYASSRLAAWLAPKQPDRLLWLEVVVITLLGLVLAELIRSQHALATAPLFPWLWLLPTLLALRYGTLAALASAALLAAAAGVSMAVRAEYAAFSPGYFLGGLVLVLGAGQFADIWRGRLQRVREVNSYLDQRLEALTRQHHILRLSYDRIEQDMMVRPLTLRSTLAELCRLTLPDGPGTPLTGPEALMRILVQTGQLEKASLHMTRDDAIQIKPAAVVGAAGGLNLRDPLVLLALERNALCHVQTASLHCARSSYLVVAPLVNAEGHCLGLLVVERMPFLCLNKDSLLVLSMTLGYFADMISVDPHVAELCRRVQGCPSDFAEELLRLERIYRECGISSTLVALSFDLGERQQRMVFADMQRQCRRLDISWPIHNGSHSILLTILPLHGPVAAAGYVSRMNDRLSGLLGRASLLDSGLHPFVDSLGIRSAAEVLGSLLKKCQAVQGQAS